MTAEMRKVQSIMIWWLALLASTSSFTIQGSLRLYKPNNSAVFMAPAETEKDFELLIQAATAGSSAYPLGGDFAGLASTFNPGDGSFIPIPEHLIPEALITWGQEPKCLQMLVSEELKSNVLERSTITILPDARSSIDNLETTKVQDYVNLSSQWGENTNVVGLQYQIDDNGTLRLETIFGLDNGHRMRVAIDLIPSDTVFAVESPMVITKERRTSSISSSGVIADGGGLNGRIVSLLLGEELRNPKTFAEEMPLGGSFESNGIKQISFPGGVSIAYGWLTNDNEWVLQVGQIYNGVRRVVSRQFSEVYGEELDLRVESWEEEVADIDTPFPTNTPPSSSNGVDGSVDGNVDGQPRGAWPMWMK